MSDVYNLDKGSKQRKLVTSHEGATVKLGNGDLKLIQQASVQYQQRTDARFELGSDRLYWATGQSQGNMTLNKLVGAQSRPWDGMGSGLQAGRGNAYVDFTLSSQNGGVTGDGIFSQIGFSMTVGDMAIADTAVLAVANLRQNYN